MNQEYTRKKFQKILCPTCGSKSKISKVITPTLCYRKCEKGHTFTYDHNFEEATQKEKRYKI